MLYRGGAEQKIRKFLIENNYVDTVIQLPQNLFFGVGIATCIIVLKKGKKKDSSVLFIDASGQFVKNGNKNKLTPENQDTITKLYADRTDVQHLAKLVSNDDIISNDCNLSVSSYVEQEDKREKIDIVAVNSQVEALSKEVESLRSEISSLIAKMEA